MIGMVLASMSFGILAMMATGRSLSISLSRLRDQARAIIDGDLSRRVEPAGPEEVRDLAAALNRMAEELQTREEYILGLSHDLRSPLTVILGHAQLIQHSPERTEVVLRSADAIVMGVRRMNAMIQEMFDAARLEAGQIKVQQVSLDLRRYLVDLKERLEGTVEPGRIRLEAPEGLPLAHADPNWLERIMLNLLTNALNYSYPGTQVIVRLSSESREIVTSVADEGPGIPPEELPQLFRRFGRTRQAREQHDGLGLGLYIAKGLVEAQRGRIWVESQVGRGSVFSFALPVWEETSQ